MYISFHIILILYIFRYKKNRKFKIVISTNLRKLTGFSWREWETIFFVIMQERVRSAKNPNRMSTQPDKAPSLPIIIGKYLGLVSCVLTILPDWLGSSLITVTA